MMKQYLKVLRSGDYSTQQRFTVAKRIIESVIEATRSHSIK